MVFALIFLTVYFFINLYFFRKLKEFLNLRTKLIYSLPLLLTLSPILYRFYDRAGYENFLLSLSILVWMGFVLLFVVYHLFIDIYHGMLKLSHLLLGHNPWPHISPKYGFLSATILSLVSTGYGYYETLNLREYRFELLSDKVEKDLKIMQISDLHLNQVMREEKIKLVLDIYKREKPDIVVSTGDLVDGNLRNKEVYVDLLRSINPTLGKYAILGNHEYYVGVEQAVNFTQRAGFMLLRDSYVYLPFNIAIVGLDDDEASRFGVKRKYTEREILERVDRSKFVIFLRHQPRIDKSLIPMFDLALSGHTHGGVLFPVKYILRRMFITDFGFIREGGSYIFVSRGVGTGGPPIRIGAPPDVAIFYIKKVP